jgi:hypothetical protein
MRKSNIVHTGLGGSIFNKLQDSFPQAPVGLLNVKFVSIIYIN